MTFGERLTDLRISNGYAKRNEFADKIGIPSTTLRNYETGAREPGHTFLKRVSELFNVSVDYLLGLTDEQEVLNSFRLKSTEYDHIKGYRALDDHGRESVDITLTRETMRVESLAAKDQRIAELEAAQAPTGRRIIPFIDLQPHISNMSHMVEYFRSASAGDGVFIMGSEGTEQVRIPDVPGVHEMDYVIKISGTSMEPDYHDEDVVLVSRTAEMHYGDVGIFVINGKAYIKEYGKYELMSRNPESPNIKISEYDNIVCMGKVVGRIREEDMIKV